MNLIWALLKSKTIQKTIFTVVIIPILTKIYAHFGLPVPDGISLESIEAIIQLIMGIFIIKNRTEAKGPIPMGKTPRGNAMRASIMVLCICILPLCACSEWWDGNGTGNTCHVFFDMEHVQNCEYIITLYALPCQDKVAMFRYSCGSFQDRFIPAVNGVATFETNFYLPDTYLIEITAYDQEGDPVASYDGGHEVTCREGY